MYLFYAIKLNEAMLMVKNKAGVVMYTNSLKGGGGGFLSLTGKIKAAKIPEH